MKDRMCPVLDVSRCIGKRCMAFEAVASPPEPHGVIGTCKLFDVNVWDGDVDG